MCVCMCSCRERWRSEFDVMQAFEGSGGGCVGGRVGASGRGMTLCDQPFLRPWSASLAPIRPWRGPNGDGTGTGQDSLPRPGRERGIHCNASQAKQSIASHRIASQRAPSPACQPALQGRNHSLHQLAQQRLWHPPLACSALVICRARLPIIQDLPCIPSCHPAPNSHQSHLTRPALTFVSSGDRVRNALVHDTAVLSPVWLP